MDFLHSLDMQRYGDFVVETVNNMSSGVMNQPATVNEVFTIANSRLVVKRSGNRNVGASFATIEETNKGNSKTTWKPKGGNAGRRDNKPAFLFPNSTGSTTQWHLRPEIMQCKVRYVSDSCLTSPLGHMLPRSRQTHTGIPF